MLVPLLVVAVVLSGWNLSPESSPVALNFIRYERSGSDWHAYVEIRNNTSRPVSYRSDGITSTHYVWDSPQIDWALRVGSPLVTLPPNSNAVFRVLVMTTDDDWRVGIDCVIGPPRWSKHLPAWLVERLQRVGLVKYGEQRTWSQPIKRPRLGKVPKNLEPTGAI